MLLASAETSKTTCSELTVRRLLTSVMLLNKIVFIQRQKLIRSFLTWLTLAFLSEQGAQCPPLPCTHRLSILLLTPGPLWPIPACGGLNSWYGTYDNAWLRGNGAEQTFSVYVGVFLVQVLYDSTKNIVSFYEKMTAFNEWNIVLLSEF